MSAIITISLLATFIIGVIGFIKLAPQIGANPEGNRLERMKASEHYKNGKFINTVSTNMDMDFKQMRPVMWEFFKGSPDRQPQDVINTIPFDADQFLNTPDTGVVFSWFGHSSLLIKIDGLIFLVDPVFSKRASMVSFMGPKRFDYSDRSE